MRRWLNTLGPALILLLLPLLAAAQPGPPLQAEAPPPPPPPAARPSPPPPPATPGTPPPPPAATSVAPPAPGAAAAPLGGESAPRLAGQALATARSALSRLQPGMVRALVNPRGERELAAGLLYRGRVVAVIHLAPPGDRPLPLGLPAPAAGTPQELETARRNLPAVVSSLRVLSGAEYRQPEGCWLVPLAWQGMIVARLKVSSPGTALVPDYPAEQALRAGAPR